MAQNCLGNLILCSQNINVLFLFMVVFGMRMKDANTIAIPNQMLNTGFLKFSGMWKETSRQFVKLTSMGWKVEIVWVCELKKDAERRLDELARFIAGCKRSSET